MLCSILFFVACEKKSSIPSYIHIDKINFTTDTATQGSSSNRIVDAWIYVNDIALGAFELPCTLPVIADGNAQITISPGIMKNGISNTRGAYFFYTSDIRTEKLSPLKIDTIVPSFTYTSSAKFNLIEDFELGSSFIKNTGSDTGLARINTAGEVFEGNSCGLITLTPAKPYCEIMTSAAYAAIASGPPVFVELNYKNDVEFTVGIIANTATSSVEYWQTTVTPKSSWSKIYIDLSDPIHNLGSISYQIVIKATGSSSSVSKIYLDNIKVVSL